MANIQINIPDDKLSKILDAFDQIIGGRPDGVSKGQWAKQGVIKYVKSIVRKKEELDHQSVIQHEEVDIT